MTLTRHARPATRRIRAIPQAVVDTAATPVLTFGGAGVGAMAGGAAGWLVWHHGSHPGGVVVGIGSAAALGLLGLVGGNLLARAITPWWR